MSVAQKVVAAPNPHSLDDALECFDRLISLSDRGVAISHPQLLGLYHFIYSATWPPEFCSNAGNIALLSKLIAFGSEHQLETNRAEVILKGYDSDASSEATGSSMSSFSSTSSLPRGSLIAYDAKKVMVLRNEAFAPPKSRGFVASDIHQETLDLFYLLAGEETSPEMAFRDRGGAVSIPDLQALILCIKEEDIRYLMIQKMYDFLMDGHHLLGHSALTKKMRDMCVKLEYNQSAERFRALTELTDLPDLESPCTRSAFLSHFTSDSLEQVELCILKSRDPHALTTALIAESVHLEDLHHKLCVFQNILPDILAKIKRTSAEYLTRQKASIQVMQKLTSTEALVANLQILDPSLGKDMILQSLRENKLFSDFIKAFQIYCDTIVAIPTPADIDVANFFDSYKDRQKASKVQLQAGMDVFLHTCGLVFDHEEGNALRSLDLVADESRVPISMCNYLFDLAYRAVLPKEHPYLQTMKGNYLLPKDVYFGQEIGNEAVATPIPLILGRAFTIPNKAAVGITRTVTLFESNYALLKPRVSCEARECGPHTHLYRSGTYGVFKADSKAIQHLPPRAFENLKHELCDVFSSVRDLLQQSPDFWETFLRAMSKQEKKDGDSVIKIATLLHNPDSFVRAVMGSSLLDSSSIAVISLLTKHLFSLSRAVLHLVNIATEEVKIYPNMTHLVHHRMGAIRGSDESESKQLILETQLARILDGCRLMVKGRAIQISTIYTNIPHNNGTAEAELHENAHVLWRPHNTLSLTKMRAATLHYHELLDSNDSHRKLLEDMDQCFNFMEHYFETIPFNATSGSLLPLAQLFQQRLSDLFNMAESTLSGDTTQTTVHVSSVHCKSGLDRTAMLSSIILYFDSIGASIDDIHEAYKHFLPLEKRSTLTPSDLVRSLSKLSHISDITIAEDESIDPAKHPLFVSLFGIKNMEFWKASRFITATKPNVVGLDKEVTWAGVPLLYYHTLGEEGAQG